MPLVRKDKNAAVYRKVGINSYTKEDLNIGCAKRLSSAKIEEGGCHGSH